MIFCLVFVFLIQSSILFILAAAASSGSSSAASISTREEALRALFTLKFLKLYTVRSGTIDAKTRALYNFIQSNSTPPSVEAKSDGKMQAVLDAFPDESKATTVSSYFETFWDTFNYGSFLFTEWRTPDLISYIQKLEIKMVGGNVDEDKLKAFMIYATSISDTYCIKAFSHDQRLTFPESFEVRFSQRFSFTYYKLQETSVAGMSFYVRDDCLIRMRRFPACADWETKVASQIVTPLEYTPQMKTILARKDALWEIIAALRHPPMLQFLRKTFNLDTLELKHEVKSASMSRESIGPKKILLSILQDEKWPGEIASLASVSDEDLLINEMYSGRPVPFNLLQWTLFLLQDLEGPQLFDSYPKNVLPYQHEIFRTDFEIHEHIGQRIHNLLRNLCQRVDEKVSNIVNLISCPDQEYPQYHRFDRGVERVGNFYRCLAVHKLGGGSFSWAIYLHREWVDQHLLGGLESKQAKEAFWNQASTIPSPSPPPICNEEDKNRDYPGNEQKEAQVRRERIEQRRIAWFIRHETSEQRATRQVAEAEQERLRAEFEAGQQLPRHRNRVQQEALERDMQERKRTEEEAEQERLQELQEEEKMRLAEETKNRPEQQVPNITPIRKSQQEPPRQQIQAVVKGTKSKISTKNKEKAEPEHVDEPHKSSDKNKFSWVLISLIAVLVLVLVIIIIGMSYYSYHRKRVPENKDANHQDSFPQ